MVASDTPSVLAPPILWANTPVIDCCGFAGLSGLSNQEEGTRHIHTVPSSVPVASMPVSWHMTDVVTLISGISDHSATPMEHNFDMATVEVEVTASAHKRCPPPLFLTVGVLLTPCKSRQGTWCAPWGMSGAELAMDGMACSGTIMSSAK